MVGTLLTQGAHGTHNSHVPHDSDAATVTAERRHATRPKALRFRTASLLSTTVQQQRPKMQRQYSTMGTSHV